MARRTFARTAGRKGSAWRACQQAVRERDGDICVWCGHPGSGDTNHNLGLAAARELGLANDPQHCSPIHGSQSGCPVCPPVYSRNTKRWVRRNCNGEVGSRPLAVALAQRGQHTQRHGDRQW